MPVGLRLFLPKEWATDPARLKRRPPSKGEIALTELDRLRAAGVRFGVVLTDAGCGCSAVVWQGLDALGLIRAVGIARNPKAYDLGVRLVSPGGRAREPVLDQEPREAEAACWDAPKSRRGGFAAVRTTGQVG